MKEEIESKYMIEKTCKTCSGKRLKDVVLAITVNNKSIHDLTSTSIMKYWNSIINGIKKKKSKLQLKY